MPRSKAKRGPLSDEPTEYFDRDPFPKIEEGTLGAGQTVTVQYDNGVNEVSETKKIQVDAPPDVTVEIKREEDNQNQGVHSAMRVGALEQENNHPFLKFRSVERDVPLTTRKNQKLYVILQNPYAFTISYRVKIFKNALRFYLPMEKAKNNNPGR